MCGMFSGMKSYQESETVLDDLGDKFLTALGEAVAATRGDLAEYRSAFPHFVADASARGLANWIHDRLWIHFSTQLQDLSDVELREKGATREILVGTTYRLRLKRHHDKGEVSTYPTQMALEFLSQLPEEPALPGLEGVHLIAGYHWLDDAHDIGPAVLSLRDGQNNILWIKELPEAGAADSVETLPDQPEPRRPTIRDHHAIHPAERTQTDNA